MHAIGGDASRYPLLDTISSPSTTPSDGNSEADVAAGGAPQDVMSAFMLAIMLRACGPFGVEPSLRAAGNLYTIIGFTVMPLIWSVPEALMTYELSSEYPCDSGSVRFTEEAFGETWGFIVGYVAWASYVPLTASLPNLFLSYLLDQFFTSKVDPMNHYEHYGILVVITLVLAYVNFRGLDNVGYSVSILFVISITPVILMVVLGIPKVDPSKWLQTPEQDDSTDDDHLPFTGHGWFSSVNVAGIAFSPFINNLYWHYIGFDNASHYSDMVTKKTLRNGIVGSVLLVTFLYLLPILIATGATSMEQADWIDGSMALAGTDIGGRWLGNWITLASGIALLGEFISLMASLGISISGLAKRGQFPPIFRHVNRHDVPSYALLLNVIIVLAFLPFPFVTICGFSNFTFTISTSIQFAAFFQLKVRNGDSTTFVKTLYCIMLIFPMIINVLIILTASYATYIYGIFVAVFGALSVLARPCLVDEELIQSRHEEELNNGRPERHFYASPTMMSGNSEEGDLGDKTTSLLDESLLSD